MDRETFAKRLDTAWPHLPAGLRERLIEFADQVFLNHIAALRNPDSTAHYEFVTAEAGRAFLTKIVRAKPETAVSDETETHH